MRYSSCVLALAAALSIAACGGDDKEEPTTAADTPAVTEESKPGTTAEQIAARISKKTKSKPSVPGLEGDPPKELKKVDVVKGSGKTAKEGDEVSMQYVGVSWSTGEEFDASWTRNEPFDFNLGGGMVIQGWDQGIVGMKEGGRRLLVIPPDLGYGAAGSPPAIGPDETLVFVVDLVKVK